MIMEISAKTICEKGWRKMVKFKGMTIQLRRSGETIIFTADDYEEAAFENTEGIDGNLPYLRIRCNDGLGQYYPLEYWEITITGGRRC